MMFEQFMQMGGPAAFAIVGTFFAVGGVFITIVVRNQIEREARRVFELRRIEASERAKLIEHAKERQK